MKFVLVLAAIVAQVASQGANFMNRQVHFTPAQLQDIQNQQQQYQQLIQQQLAAQQQQQYAAQQVNQKPTETIQVTNEQILAIAAANGMDVEAIRQNLLAGRPVEIDMGQLNQAARPQTQQPQQLKQSPLANPQNLRAVQQHLMNTAADPKVKQMIQTQDFQQWLNKLVNGNPNIVGIRNVQKMA